MNDNIFILHFYMHMDSLWSQMAAYFHDSRWLFFRHSMFLMIQGPIFWSALLGWFGAQFIKFCVYLFSHKKKFSWVLALQYLLWKTGGMPSSHSSVVSALSMSIALQEGMNSPVFILSFVFSCLVVRDAVGMRQTVGKVVKAYNQLIKTHNKTSSHKKRYLKEVNGHKPREVFSGVILGILMGLTVTLYL